MPEIFRVYVNYLSLYIIKEILKNFNPF